MIRPPTSQFLVVGPVTLTFSPKGDAESLIIKLLDGATKTVWVQAYEFSSKPICDAVIRAHVRGLDVQVLLDKENKVNLLSKWINVVGRNSLLPALRAAGVFVMFDTSPTIAHSKIVIVDGAIVATGSFNFSSAAQNTNTENLLVIRDTAVASAYLVNFAWRMSLSKS